MEKHTKTTHFLVVFSIFGYPKNSLKEFVKTSSLQKKTCTSCVSNSLSWYICENAFPKQWLVLCDFSTGEVIKHVQTPKVLLSSTFHKKKAQMLSTSLHFGLSHLSFHFEPPLKEVVRFFMVPSRETNGEKHTHRRSAPSKRSSVCAP